MVPKNWLFFLSRSPTHHSFIFDLRFFYELKHKVRLSKTVCGILHFQFRFVFIKVYICVQQDAWKLWLLDVIIPFKINPIQDGHFRGYSRMEGGKFAPLTKICQLYPTVMKLGTVIPYLKKIQKIYQSRCTPLSSADISIFSPEIIKFCHIKKYRYRVHFDT